MGQVMSAKRPASRAVERFAALRGLVLVVGCGVVETSWIGR